MAFFCSNRYRYNLVATFCVDFVNQPHSQKHTIWLWFRKHCQQPEETLRYAERKKKQCRLNWRKFIFAQHSIYLLFLISASFIFNQNPIHFVLGAEEKHPVRWNKKKMLTWKASNRRENSSNEKKNNSQITATATEAATVFRPHQNRLWKCWICEHKNVEKPWIFFFIHFKSSAISIGTFVRLGTWNPHFGMACFNEMNRHNEKFIDLINAIVDIAQSSVSTIRCDIFFLWYTIHSMLGLKKNCDAVFVRSLLFPFAANVKYRLSS